MLSVAREMESAYHPSQTGCEVTAVVALWALFLGALLMVALRRRK
jgi:hypothetical protein